MKPDEIKRIGAIRRIRGSLLDLKESYSPPDEYVAEQEQLARVLDAWDDFEYAAGTDMDGENGVQS